MRPTRSRDFMGHSWGHSCMYAGSRCPKTMPLTETAIKALKGEHKTRRIYDERCLYLEFTPTGSKLWRFKYRVDGIEKRLAIGTYPAISLRSARDARERARADLARKVDPGAVKRAQKAVSKLRSATSFEVIAREYFQRQLSRWSEGHQTRWLRLVPYRCIMERAVSIWHHRRI